MDSYSAHGTSETSLCPDFLIYLFILFFNFFLRVQLSSMFYVLSNKFSPLVSLGRQPHP